jgi:SAM-dependent methyltransferase
MSLRERLARRLGSATPEPPQPTPPSSHNDYKAAWNEAARANAQDAVLTGSSPEYFESTARNDAARIQRHLRGGEVVLNIGCGIGRVDLYIAPLVKEIWAIDVSGEMLARARERLNAHGNVRFVEVGNRDFLSFFHTQSMDLVFSYLVLQHLEKEDAVKYMSEVARVLKPGGAFVTQFPNYLSPEYEHTLELESEILERSPGRVRPYTEEEVRRTLGVLGFEIVELYVEGGREDSAEIYVVARTRV